MIRELFEELNAPRFEFTFDDWRMRLKQLANQFGNKDTLRWDDKTNTLISFKKGVVPKRLYNGTYGFAVQYTFFDAGKDVKIVVRGSQTVREIVNTVNKNTLTGIESLLDQLTHQFIKANGFRSFLWFYWFSKSKFKKQIGKGEFGKDEISDMVKFTKEGGSKTHWYDSFSSNDEFNIDNSKDFRKSQKQKNSVYADSRMLRSYPVGYKPK